MSKRSQQLLYVVGAIVLTLVLYFASRKVEKMATADAKASVTFETQLQKAK